MRFLYVLIAITTRLAWGVPLSDTLATPIASAPATVSIRCSDQSWSTAQLVGAQNVIVTSAHALFDKSCHALLDPANGCQIKTEDGNTWTLNLAIEGQTFFVGTHCPYQDLHNDWMVAKLVTPLPKAFRPLTPAIPALMQQLLKVGQPIQMIAVVNETPLRRTLVACRIRDLTTFPQTDCTSDVGSSGSAETVGEYLIGIHTYGKVDDVLHPSFKTDTNFNDLVPLTGAFFNAVMNLTGH